MLTKGTGCYQDSWLIAKQPSPPHHGQATELQFPASFAVKMSMVLVLASGLKKKKKNGKCYSQAFLLKASQVPTSDSGPS